MFEFIEIRIYRKEKSFTNINKLKLEKKKKSVQYIVQVKIMFKKEMKGMKINWKSMLYNVCRPHSIVEDSEENIIKMLLRLTNIKKKKNYGRKWDKILIIK